MATNGVPIYPFSNNRGESVWDSCEADYCNAHSGRGEDYHYHGDPFGPKCMYDKTDYVKKDKHPPLVGWAADGYPIYGRYIKKGDKGQRKDLDECNGHDHDNLGYHYHADQKEVTKKDRKTGRTNTWTEYQIGPTKCFGGDVTQIKNFWAREGWGTK